MLGDGVLLHAALRLAPVVLLPVILPLAGVGQVVAFVSALALTVLDSCALLM